MSVPALEMKVLRPLIRQPSSSGTACVLIPRASDPASGSVRPKAPSARPSASGRSQRSRCSSLPNSSSGSDPIVRCACSAAATDWSAWPICSIAATKPTVDIPMPPHCSGTSMPSSPARPSRAAGRWGTAPPAMRPVREWRSPSARSRGRARPGRARHPSARSPRADSIGPISTKDARVGLIGSIMVDDRCRRAQRQLPAAARRGSDGRPDPADRCGDRRLPHCLRKAYRDRDARRDHATRDRPERLGSRASLHDELRQCRGRL